jgi:hypothetical protein
MTQENHIPEKEQPPLPLAAQKTPWWFLLGLYVLGVIVLSLLAYRVAGPLDVDGAYYFLVARNLAQGRGLAVDALWHFFQPTTELPQPAGDLWMPVASLLMTPALLIGETFRHAQGAQVLLAALLPLLAFKIARDEGASLPWATLAGFFTLLAGTVTVHWVDTDSYTAHALVGGMALYAMGRGFRKPRWLIAGGLLGGLAALTRNDGIVLLGVLWAFGLLASLQKKEHPPWRDLLLGTLLFALPVLLWNLRNVIVFGEPNPASLGFLLTMRRYNDILAYQPQADWAGFWEQGLGSLLALRGRSLQATLTVFGALLQFWGLVPFVWATTRLRRRPALWPAFLYLAGLFLALNGLFPFLVLHGTWSRSVTAFLPTAYACVALGMQAIVEKLLHWRPNLPARLLHHTFLMLAFTGTVLVGVSAIALQLEPALDHPHTWQQVGSWLQENSTPDEVIMAQDPMSTVLYGERRAVGIPFEEPALFYRVSQDYGVSKIVLVGRFQNLLPSFLQDLYQNAASQPPFTLLWQEGEIQIYELEP